MSELYRAREVRKMIVVAIVPVNRENGKSPIRHFFWKDPKNWSSVTEYTHTQWFPQRPFGGLDIYADYLAEDLKGKYTTKIWNIQWKGNWREIRLINTLL